MNAIQEQDLKTRVEGALEDVLFELRWLRAKVEDEESTNVSFPKQVRFTQNAVERFRLVTEIFAEMVDDEIACLENFCPF